MMLLIRDFTRSPEAVPRIKPIAIPINPWSLMNFLKPASCAFGSTFLSLAVAFLTAFTFVVFLTVLSFLLIPYILS